MLALDQQQGLSTVVSDVSSIAQRTHKFPHSERGHIGIQVKVTTYFYRSISMWAQSPVEVYDRNEIESFKSTDVVTFIGIISTEPLVKYLSPPPRYDADLMGCRCGLDHAQETPSEVPTLHVLFTKPHTPNLLPRPFPRLVQASGSDLGGVLSGEPAKTVAEDTAGIRRELIKWIADEALGGDLQAAEWVLFSCIARV